jgi:hypothetical protein
MKNIMLVVAGFVLGALLLVAVHAQGTNKDPHPTKEVVQPSVLTKDQLFSQGDTADVLAIESVFSAYTFYNDSHNGPGAASLFTDDAIIHFVWDNHGTLVPEFGINPHDTPDGPNGEGCVLTGHKDIATYFGYNRDVNNQPLALPFNSHHMATNKMVKVNGDGKSAMLTATWMTAGGGRGGNNAAAIGGTGMYRIFFRKTTNDGWLISEFYGIGDRPSTTTNCDLHGPLPRPSN